MLRVISFIYLFTYLLTYLLTLMTQHLPGLDAQGSNYCVKIRESSIHHTPILEQNVVLKKHNWNVRLFRK